MDARQLEFRLNDWNLKVAMVAIEASDRHATIILQAPSILMAPCPNKTCLASIPTFRTIDSD